MAIVSALTERFLMRAPGPINRQIIWRRNQVLNNGGLAVRGNTADVLVENTQVCSVVPHR
jgi:hypothetical protein